MLTTAGAGCGATILHDAVMVPADGMYLLSLILCLLGGAYGSISLLPY